MKKYGEEFFASKYKGYLVSKSGKVFSLKTQQLIGGQLDDEGYITMCLMVEGKRKFVRLHRMIAEAFLKKPSGNPQVRHKNGKKTDNRLVNLYWTNDEEE